MAAVKEDTQCSYLTNTITQAQQHGNLQNYVTLQDPHQLQKPQHSQKEQTAYFVSQIGEESILIPPLSSITTYTDNKSLHDSTNTTNQVADRRLRVEISAIREMKDKDEISINWIRQSSCRLFNKKRSFIDQHGISSTKWKTLIYNQLYFVYIFK